ncbi:ATP-binding protein [Thermococcus indicus]|uniref:ATP-binding protein n=1 Tax=Thermococcus indicus TaxID=2586643 RepID=A0A4Y5SLL8_9EURY|nr:ATP-binding protein [Thermococcus indicus]QDA31778.1 ATP-binding protein [Thermococcus indicus]
MYFDERPKARREDLYDRERELEDILNSINSRKPLILLKGIRRLGKTSLLRVALNEAKLPHVIVDLRGVNPNSRRDLYLRFQAALNEYLLKNAPLLKRLKDKIRLIDGVRISGVGVSLSWKNPETLYSLVSALESEGFLIAFDEVQEIRGPAGKGLASLIAHFYDYGETSFILTGSEIGLLYEFIGIEDPTAPLYGRVFHEIELSRFSREQSIDFLRKGFEQAGIEAPSEILEDAVNRLDGIVGWLVKFGTISLREGLSKKTVDIVLEEASKMALGELDRFLEKRPLARKRYLTVLHAIARGRNTWSELKRELEKAEKREITDATLARLLDALLKASFIEKRVNGRNITYHIADPVLEFALKG